MDDFPWAGLAAVAMIFGFWIMVEVTIRSRRKK